MYASWLVTTGRVKSAQTLANYLSCVSTLHKKEHLPCPVPSEYGPLKNLMTGFKRQAQRPIKRSLPITPSLLSSFIHDSTNLDPQNITLRIFGHYALLSFISMLRTSNIVPASRTKYDHRMVLTWECVLPGPGNSYILLIRKSKNNQFGERVHRVPLTECSDPRYCPVAAIRDLRQLYGDQVCRNRGPVFRLPSKHGNWTIMTRHDFKNFFKYKIGSLGLNPGNYSLHGLRHGGIQECLLAEPNVALCQVATDHQSDAIRVYANVPVERRLHIAAAVCSRLAADATIH